LGLDFDVPYLIADVMEIFAHFSRNTGTHVRRVKERDADSEWFAVPLINNLDRSLGLYIIRNGYYTRPHDIRTIDNIGYRAGIHDHSAFREGKLYRAS
jgi:hypothetical protein